MRQRIRSQRAADRADSMAAKIGDRRVAGIFADGLCGDVSSHSVRAGNDKASVDWPEGCGPVQKNDLQASCDISDCHTCTAGCAELSPYGPAFVVGSRRPYSNPHLV